MVLKRGPASGSCCEPLAELRRPDRVDREHVRQVLLELRLDRAEYTAPPDPIDTTDDRSYDFWSSASQRPGHGVAHHHDGHGPLAFGEHPRLVRVEAVGVQHDLAATEEHDAHAPLGGAA